MTLPPTAQAPPSGSTQTACNDSRPSRVTPVVTGDQLAPSRRSTTPEAPTAKAAFEVTPTPWSRGTASTGRLTKASCSSSNTAAVTPPPTANTRWPSPHTVKSVSLRPLSKRFHAWSRRRRIVPDAPTTQTSPVPFPHTLKKPGVSPATRGRSSGSSTTAQVWPSKCQTKPLRPLVDEPTAQTSLGDVPHSPNTVCLASAGVPRRTKPEPFHCSTWPRSPAIKALPSGKACTHHSAP